MQGDQPAPLSTFLNQKITWNGMIKMSTLGVRLKHLREKHGWSQLFVGNKLNIPNTTISGYERDYREPDFVTLIRFSQLYEVSTDYLLIGETKTEDLLAMTDSNDNQVVEKMDVTMTGSDSPHTIVQAKLRAMLTSYKEGDKKHIPISILVDPFLVRRVDDIVMRLKRNDGDQLFSTREEMVESAIRDYLEAIGSLLLNDDRLNIEERIFPVKE